MSMKKYLFTCVENADSSPMAEAFKKYAPESFRVSSAGTKPTDRTNPTVIKAMQEVGIKLSGMPKTLNSEDLAGSAKIINMGRIDQKSCPALFVSDVDNWDMSESKGKSLDEIRNMHIRIESKVKELISNIKT